MTATLRLHRTALPQPGLRREPWAASRTAAAPLPPPAPHLCGPIVHRGALGTHAEDRTPCPGARPFASSGVGGCRAMVHSPLLRPLSLERLGEGGMARHQKALEGRRDAPATDRPVCAMRDARHGRNPAGLGEEGPKYGDRRGAHPASRRPRLQGGLRAPCAPRACCWEPQAAAAAVPGIGPAGTCRRPPAGGLFQRGRNRRGRSGARRAPAVPAVFRPPHARAPLPLSCSACRGRRAGLSVRPCWGCRHAVQAAHMDRRRWPPRRLRGEGERRGDRAAQGPPRPAPVAQALAHAGTTVTIRVRRRPRPPAPARGHPSQPPAVHPCAAGAVPARPFRVWAGVRPNARGMPMPPRSWEGEEGAHADRSPWAHVLPILPPRLTALCLNGRHYSYEHKFSTPFLVHCI